MVYQQQNMEKVKLDVQENIQLGQCFNLAHAELLEKGIIPSQAQVKLEERTIKLFFIKENINIKLQLEKKKMVDPLHLSANKDKPAITQLQPIAKKVMKI